MMLYRRATLIRLSLVLVMLVVAGIACNLSTKTDDKNAGRTPTELSSGTPRLTNTPLGGETTPTLVPTWTPRPSFIPPPTATPVAWIPTATPYPTLPPLTLYPYDIRISSPVNGSTLVGYTTIMGSASHPSFLQYALEWAPGDNPGLWYPLNSPPQASIVINRVLGFWDTTVRQDGNYYLRLHVWLKDGSEIYYPTQAGMQARISNRTPVPQPTATPTLRPNQPPRIDPIANQTIQASRTTQVLVRTSDPNGDAVELFVASSNPAVATVSTNNKQSPISVTGVTAGQATIRVTANDGYGGLANAFFIVTVEGQNRAPTLNPILSQTLKVGENRYLSISASDPDNDALTVSATSVDIITDPDVVPDTRVVIVHVPNPNANIVRLIGGRVGSAVVTVTVDDGRGGKANTSFQVSVGEPNRNPTIDPVPNQTMTAGNTIDVPFNTSDPDGDTLTARVISDNPAIASVIISPDDSRAIRITANGPGSALVAINVNDKYGGFASTSFWVIVGQPNRNPTIDDIPDRLMLVGETDDVSFTTSDPDNDPLAAIATSSDSNIVSVFVPAFGTVRLNAVGAGTVTITVSVEDGRGGTASTEFSVEVEQPNRDPIIGTISNQTITVGETRTVTYSAYDPDGDTITAAVSSSNTGVVAASSPALLKVDLTGNAAGTATVTVTVNDGRGGSTDTSFQVTVQEQPNDDPTIDSISNQTIAVGETINLPFTASDPDSDPLSATVQSDDENVALAFVLTFGTVQVFGNAEGTADITVTVDDGRGGTASTTFSVTVEPPPNNDPTIISIPDQTMTVGDTLNVPFTASDPDSDTLTSVAESDNGSVVAAFTPSLGTVQLVAYTAGSATVTVGVDDGRGGSAAVAFTVTVEPPPNSDPTIGTIPNQIMGVGDTLDVPYTADDPDSDPLTATATSDDEGVVSTTGSTLGNVALQTNDFGTAIITVTVEDGQGGSASTTFSVTVEPPPNNDPTIDPIPDQTMAAGETLNVSYTANDVDSDLLTATATSSNEGVVSTAGSTLGTVVLTANVPGSANITVSVDDGRGGSASTTFAVGVGQPPNNDPTIDPIPDQAMTVGDMLDVGYVFDDVDVDTLTATATSDNEGVVSTTGSTLGNVHLTANTSGGANITVTVDDGRGGTASTIFTVLVQPPANNDPTIDPIPDQTLTVGDTLDVGYTADDVDSDPLTATVTSNNESIVSTAGSTLGNVHLSANASGSANITVTVDDGRGGSASTAFVVGVGQPPNNDPTIGGIPDQTMAIGDTFDVPYTADDADSDSLAVTTTSSNESIVSTAGSTLGNVHLAASASGSANITVTVDDGRGGTASTIFAVLVQPPANNDPTIGSIPDQTMTFGQTLDVPYTTSDPDSDPLVATVTSNNPGVVSTAGSTLGNVVLTANNPGNANITVSVEDGRGGVATAIFGVLVEPPANNDPTINPIPDQTLTVGQTLPVPYTFSDPDSDPLSATTTSGNEGVVSTAGSALGTAVLTANTPGSTNITVTVNDGRGGSASVTFGVLVEPPANNDPTLNMIPDQTLLLGQAPLSVPFTASDPDSDPLSATASSENEGIVVASVPAFGTVSLVPVGTGSTTVNVAIADGRGGVASVSFFVTVNEQPNNPPVIPPVGEQVIPVGGEPATVPVNPTDPDGEPITLTALPQNPAIVQATVEGNAVVRLLGLEPGTTQINLTAEDARGATTIGSFTVTVESGPPPGVDLSTIPVIPQLTQPQIDSLQLVYQSGVTNFSIQAGTFAKVGDDPIDSDNFMKPFATPGAYNLGTHTDLQTDVINVYLFTPVHPGIDPAPNSFNVDSVATGPSFDTGSLFMTAPAEPPCDALGGTRLACEYRATRPSIALVSFSAQGVIYMDPAAFRSGLQQIVTESLSNGVIPVLATIPADTTITTEQLSEYNAAVVEVANSAGVPLWNLWRAMNVRGITDPYSIGGSGPADLTDTAVSNGGYNVRNLTALNTLNTVRQAVGIE